MKQHFRRLWLYIRLDAALEMIESWLFASFVIGLGILASWSHFAV